MIEEGSRCNNAKVQKTIVCGSANAILDYTYHNVLDATKLCNFVMIKMQRTSNCIASLHIVNQCSNEDWPSECNSGRGTSQPILLFPSNQLMIILDSDSWLGATRCD